MDPMSRILAQMVAVFVGAGIAATCPVISEIEALPNTGAPEWIEISDLSGTVMKLRGWSLDDGTNRAVLDSSAVLRANGQLVLSPDCAGLRSRFGTGDIPCAQPSRWNRLSVTGDAVVLRDSSGKICDSVAWDAKTWGDWPAGRTLERIDLTRSGNDPSNWVASSNASGGTPGWKTNPVLESVGSAISIEVVSRRAAPGARSATIRLHAPWNARLEAGAYDLSRRKVANVFDGQIPASGELAWDGGSVRPGVYMLLLEFRTEGKDVVARFREWLVVEK